MPDTGEEKLSGELRLGYDTRAMARALVSTFVVVGGLTSLWLIAVDKVFDLRTGISDPWARSTQIGWGFLAGVVGVVVVRLVLFLRQPRGARLTYDPGGVTEWDGKDQRVSIPWTRARVSSKIITEVDKRGRQTGRIGKVCQISDEAGNLIELSLGTQPLWMNGRRNSADFAPLAPYFANVPKIDPIRGAEGRRILMWIVAIAAYSCLGLGLGMFCQSHGISEKSEFTGALLILGGVGCLFLRSLWPLFSGLRTRGDTGSKRAWRRANLIEFGLRLILAAAAALPALGVLGVGAAPVSFEVLKMGNWDPKMCVVTTEGARLERGDMQEMKWTRREGGIETHRLQAGYVMDVMALDPGDRFAAFTGLKKTVVVWDGRTGQVASSAEGHAHNISAMVFSPIGSRLATASADKTVKIWDPQGAALLHTLGGHAASVDALAFSPNGEQLASGGFKQVLLWDVETGQRLRTIEGFANSVTALAFSHDGGRLAVGEHRGGLSLVDVAEGKKFLELEPHELGVTALRFLRGGRHLISAGLDQTIRFYSVETGEQVEEVNLRADERIKKTRDYVAVLHLPRGTYFQAVTSHCAVLRVNLPPEIAGAQPR